MSQEDLRIALALQAVWDSEICTINKQENADLELALKINAELNCAEGPLNSVQSDENFARELQKIVDRQVRQEMVVEEQTGKLAALKLYKEEEERERELYISDKALALELHYQNRPSYSGKLAPAELKEIHSQSLIKVYFPERRVEQGTEYDSKLSIEEFEAEVLKPTDFVLNSTASKSTLPLAERKRLRNLEAGFQVYKNNAELRDIIHCQNHDPFVSSLRIPTFDLHGLSVEHANHRIYPFLQLARRYRWSKVQICTGVGHNSSNGRSKLITMLKAVLEKLLKEGHRGTKLIRSFDNSLPGNFLVRINVN